MARDRSDGEAGFRAGRVSEARASGPAAACQPGRSEAKSRDARDGLGPGLRAWHVRICPFLSAPGLASRARDDKVGCISRSCLAELGTHLLLPATAPGPGHALPQFAPAAKPRGGGAPIGHQPLQKKGTLTAPRAATLGSPSPALHRGADEAPRRPLRPDPPSSLRDFGGASPPRSLGNLRRTFVLRRPKT
jgi:hypothetical protein